MDHNVPHDFNKLPNNDFKVDIFQWENISRKEIFKEHFHAYLQFLYFTEGKALIQCGDNKFIVKKNNFIVVNSNELHSGKNLGYSTSFYCIKIDLDFLLSNRADLCEVSYITPLIQNQIVFKNLILNDDKLKTIADDIVAEYSGAKGGFELAIKAKCYELIVILFRNYASLILPEKIKSKKYYHDRLKNIIDFIDKNHSKKISVYDLALQACLSKHHFCRVFKEVVGRSPIDYVNYLRIREAAILLNEKKLNIWEIANSVGFEDANYFSRTFKKYEKIAPSKYLKFHADI
jgi:AraC-like DNA-binding protein/quercetin dioxygenase-like cupin family protein